MRVAPLSSIRIYLWVVCPDHHPSLKPSAQDLGAGNPRETTAAHICCRLWRTPDNHTTRSTSSSGTQDPGPLPCHWPETSFQQTLPFLPPPWESVWWRDGIPGSGPLLLPLVLWVAFSVISVYRRDWRRSFLLPLHMSFVYGNFSSLLAVGLGQLTLVQTEVSVTGTREKSIIMSCKVFSKDFSKDYIHWYRQKPDQGLEQLLFVLDAPALILPFFWQSHTFFS